jgi:hypothetical protein
MYLKYSLKPQRKSFGLLWQYITLILHNKIASLTTNHLETALQIIHYVLKKFMFARKPGEVEKALID